MLSQDLRSLLTWFEASHATGQMMSKPAAEAFAAALGVAAEAAENMERSCAVAGNARAFDDAAFSPETERLLKAARALASAANVVMLHAAPVTHRVPRPLGGGDAA